jgi:hypothetical protein
MPDPRIAQFKQAGLRAAQFTLDFQQPDGSYIWEGYVNDAFHKQSYSWALAGQVEAAQRLLNWVKRERLLPDGQLRDYNGDLYKHAWLFQGAHRLGRFDITYPMSSFIASTQAPCGGLPHFAGNDRCRALAACQAGIAMLYIGRLDFARRVGEWTVSLLDQPDENRFYFCTTLDGKLIEDPAMSIDFGQPGQVYWEIGLPQMLMCRLYMATGEPEYLDRARQFMDWQMKCHADRFSFTGSGKSGLAAALLYLLTGDLQARAGAYEFGDFLLRTQLPDGSWRNPNWGPEVLYPIDSAAEFNVWLQEIASTLSAADEVWDH